MKKGKQRETKKHNIKQRLFQFLDFPADADGTVLKITMVADRDLLVENHKGVIRYTDQLIRLHSDHGVVRIEGEGLQLSEFAMERAYIRGSVFGWQIEEKGFRDLS